MSWTIRQLDEYLKDVAEVSLEPVEQDVLLRTLDRIQKAGKAIGEEIHRRQYEGVVHCLFIREGGEDVMVSGTIEHLIGHKYLIGNDGNQNLYGRYFREVMRLGDTIVYTEIDSETYHRKTNSLRAAANR